MTVRAYRARTGALLTRWVLVALACLCVWVVPASYPAAAPAGALAQAAERAEADLAIRLDPSTRLLTAEGTWTVPAGVALTLRLDRRFTVESIQVDGTARRQARWVRNSGDWQMISLPASRARTRWQIRWRGELAPLDRTLDHRGVLAALPPMASVEGSYLPAGSGWHPESSPAVRHRITVDLPPTQRAAAAGRLLHETQDAHGTRAQFDSVRPVEGMTLMVGPYRVDERMLEIGSRRVRLRTYFSEALQPLAADYLAAAAGYLEAFDRRIGDYAFDGFNIVSSPLPTGFGLPGATYVGESVLRLPFMRGQSLAHEILHNWWGNGVQVDWQFGNWSEGLTTYLADHALREEQSTEAARQMRWGWLRDFAAVAPEKDFPLDRFTARTHGAASAVGYGKSAMLFHMVRVEIGDAAFDQALRDFWRSHAARRAGWRDLQAAFERQANRSLAVLFEPMVSQTGAPLLLPGEALWDGKGGVTLTWPAPAPFTVGVPAIAWFGDTPRQVMIPMRRGERTSRIAIDGARAPEALQIDPGFDTWRALPASESPSLLRDVMIAPDTRVVFAGKATPEWRMAALELAGRMLEARPLVQADPTDLQGPAPLLIIGLHDEIERLLKRGSPLARPKALARLPDAAIWAARQPDGAPRVFVSAQDTAALIDLHRRAPHYGARGFVGFRSGKAYTQGIGDIEVTRIPVTQQVPR